MSFLYSVEKRKLDQLWERLRKEYAAAGMSEEGIDSLYELDLDEFHLRRKIESYEQPYSGALFDEYDYEIEEFSPLLGKFIDRFSCTDKYCFTKGRFYWIEDVDDAKLRKTLMELPDADKELLTLLAFDGYSQREVAKILSVTEAAISLRVKRFRVVLSGLLKNNTSASLADSMHKCVAGGQ